MAQTLSNIYSNVGFALNLHTDALVRLQEQISTGMRVNRASDDPSSAYQILGYNSQVRSFENYIEEISSVVSGLEFSHTALENMISEIVDSRTNISQIVSGTYGQSGRERIADGINDTLEQLVLRELPARARILDLCCGTGQFAGTLTGLGYQRNAQKLQLDGSEVEIDPHFDWFLRPAIQNATQQLWRTQVDADYGAKHPDYEKHLFGPVPPAVVEAAGKRIKPYLDTFGSAQAEAAARKQANFPAGTNADEPGGRAQADLSKLSDEEQRQLVMGKARDEGRIGTEESRNQR